MSIVRLVCVLALGAPLDATLVAAPKPAVKMSPKMDTALVLRGGASLGPITPHLAMKINCVMYIYFASLFSNFLTFLPNKPFMGGSLEEKFGIAKNEPLRMQMVGALTYFGILLYKDTFFGDRAGDILTCKALSLAWGVCAIVFNCGGSPNFTESNILTVVMTALFAYLGFM